MGMTATSGVRERDAIVCTLDTSVAAET